VEPVEKDPYLIILQAEKDKGRTISQNAGATQVDLSDGVACVEFHTKVNALDEDIFNMIQEALDRAELDFEGLVIGNDDPENFSAGANLAMVLMGAKMGAWDQIESVLSRGQSILKRMRNFPKPVVVAPAGRALGGGAEVIVHGSRVVAAAELYTGFVEFGAGVIPAAGGTKEMLRRILNPAMRTQNVDALPFLQRIFEQIGMAKVATSAEEARRWGF
jgi:3-hydroxyacyl-CoA dehydrogenase